MELLENPSCSIGIQELGQKRRGGGGSIERGATLDRAERHPSHAVALLQGSQLEREVTDLWPFATQRIDPGLPRGDMECPETTGVGGQEEGGAAGASWSSSAPNSG